MHTNTEGTGWSAVLFVVMIIAAMLHSKSHKYEEAEATAAAIEATGSITR